MGLRVGQPIRKLRAWLVRSLSTSYLAATDGTVKICQSGGGLMRFFGYTDSSDPPTTLKAGGWSHEDWVDTRSGDEMRVKKGDYWQVTKTGAGVSVWWIPES